VSERGNCGNVVGMVGSALEERIVWLGEGIRDATINITFYY